MLLLYLKSTKKTMIDKAPIIFTPYLKSVVWGGNKICQYKGIPQPEPNIGESWEISAVPGHESVVAEGQYKGLSLIDLIDRFGAELLGTKVMEQYGGKFPLLIKFIDARQDLSVQVHPDDTLAMKRHNSLGKTEMWYIIQADKDAKIYAGFNSAVTPDEYVSRVADGTFQDILAVYDSAPGDVFFLPAGRVHAIGAGNLLAEIQENSDITYRIFDYNRRDAQGNLRQLHTEEAKDAIDYTFTEQKKDTPAVFDSPVTPLVDCNHFTAYSLEVDGEMQLDADPSSFSVLICIEGSATLKYPNGQMSVQKGHTVLIPAALTELTIDGKATMMLAHA